MMLCMRHEKRLVIPAKHGKLFTCISKSMGADIIKIDTMRLDQVSAQINRRLCKLFCNYARPDDCGFLLRTDHQKAINQNLKKSTYPQSSASSLPCISFLPLPFSSSGLFATGQSRRRCRGSVYVWHRYT